MERAALLSAYFVCMTKDDRVRRATTRNDGVFITSCGGGARGRELQQGVGGCSRCVCAACA